LKKAVEVLARLIRQVPVFRSQTPAFTQETYQKMLMVKQELNRQYQVIEYKRLLVEKALNRVEELRKLQNIFKKKQKEQAFKKLASAQFDFDNAQAELDRIVKRAGYRNVAAFNKAFDKACRLIEENQNDGLDNLEKRESVIAKLHQYDKEARSKRNHPDHEYKKPFEERAY
jgi:chromosome segregation ATPase